MSTYTKASTAGTLWEDTALDIALSASEANALPHDDTLRTITWRNVIHATRKAYIAEREAFWLDKIAKEREGKVKSQNVITYTQERKAKSLAIADAVSKFYQTEEIDGYRNPIHDDPVWGPAASEAEKAKEDIKPNRYGGRCPKCNQWVEEQQGKLVKLPTGKWGAEHITCPEPQAKPEPAKAQDGLDLTDVPSGYYAVPDGDTRLKVRISHGKEGSKWDGFTFVTDGAAYGQQQRYGMQRPGQNYKGQIEEQLKKIAADPLAASKAYGHLVGRCGRCNTILEDEESVANGIGPICATKF